VLAAGLLGVFGSGVAQVTGARAQRAACGGAAVPACGGDWGGRMR
jgi:hypothetical protein